MRQKITRIVLAALVLALTALVVRKLVATDRDRVIRVVRGLVRHLERHDPASFCLLLAEDYVDTHGHNRAALRALLAAGLPQLNPLSIRLENLRVEVSDDWATTDFVALIRAQGRGQASSYHWTSPVRLELRKHEGEWRVVHADYRLPEQVNY